MPTRRLAILVPVLIAFVLLLVRGVGPADRAPTLHIAAASSLRATLPDHVAAFTDANPGISAEVAYASSGTLAAAIERGAPYDVFLSADEARPARLMELGLLAQSGVQPFAVSRIVYVSRDRDASADATPRIAIPNPAFAPYGRAAEVWLSTHPEFGPHSLIYTDSVANAAGLFRAGAVDGAFVDPEHASQLALAGAQTATLDGAPPITLAAGVMRSSTRADEAERFVRFIREHRLPAQP
ncbi:MAG: molybdate transport system substrate-binding protein [Phycisphaerales bacterium]